MSKVAELILDIEEEILNGVDPKDIAKMFNVPVEFVDEVVEDLIERGYNKEFFKEDDV